MCTYVYICLYTRMHRRKRLARNTPRASQWGIMGKLSWMILKLRHICKNLDNRERYHMDWLTCSPAHPPTVPSTAATEKPQLYSLDCPAAGCALQDLEGGSEVQTTLWSLYVDMRFLYSVASASDL